MSERIRVGVIFGGRSVEHEVSLISARSILQHLDPRKYEVMAIGVTREGRWVTSSDAGRLLQTGLESAENQVPCFLPGDPSLRGLMRLSDGESGASVRPLDVVFPVVHGGHGEDGTLQGLLELADIPYVGAGVMASAVGMDKDLMKRVFQGAGLPIVRYLSLLRRDWRSRRASILEDVAGELGFPSFVKPANTGSSVGISKARDRDELARGLEEAFRFDRKAVVEAAVDAREIECGVLGNDDPIASVPGEIVSCREFYDYAAKYLEEGSQLIIPAVLRPDVVEEVRRCAISAFKAIDCAGMARVDFFLERGSDRLFLNELNTIPGFTPISMYPKLWEASGIPYSELLDRLIALARERHRDKEESDTRFRPESPGREP